MTNDPDDDRVRKVKGSLKEAIGKIIGNTDVEEQGLKENQSGKRADHKPTRNKQDRD